MSICFWAESAGAAHRIILQLFHRFKIQNLATQMMEGNSARLLCLLIAFILTRTTDQLVINFGYATFPWSLKGVKCQSYLATRMCGGFVTTASNASIQISNIKTNVLFNVNNINETFSARGLIQSYSTPVRYFVSTNPVGGVYSIDETTQAFLIVQTHNYSSYHSYHIQGDKNNTSAYFFAFVTSISPISFNSNICYRQMPSLTCTPLFTLNTQVVGLYVSQYGWAHALHLDYSTSSLNVTLFLANSTIVTNFSVPVSGNLSGTQFYLQSSFQFGIFAINSTIYGFDSSLMNGTSWTWTCPNVVISIDCMYPWVVVYDKANVTHQIQLLTGFYYGNYTTATLYNYINLIWYYSTSTYGTDYYKVGTTTLDYTTVNDSYIKCPTCTCNSGYVIGAVNTTCNATTPLTILTKLNSTAPPLPFPIVIPVPIVPTPPVVVPPSPVQPVPGGTYNAFPVNNGTSCFWPLNAATQNCKEFCSHQCGSCDDTPSSCLECSQYYLKASPESRQCDNSIKVKVIAMTYGFLNTLKSSKMVGVFAFLHNFNQYNYHRIRYQGMMESVLNFTLFLQEQEWQLVPSPQFQGAFNRFWFVSNEYIPFTNSKFLSVERKDLTFLENIKAYLCLFVPFAITIFVVLHCIQKRANSPMVQKAIKIFQFWLYLIGIVALNDTQRLSYLGFTQLINLAHFQSRTIFLQSLSVFLIGLWFILAFSLYPLYQVFCEKKAGLFFNGLRNVSISCFVLLAKCVAKPVLQGMIHCVLWSNPALQLNCLSSFEAVSFLTLSYVSIRHKIVLFKLTFIIECLLNLMTILINSLLFLKFNYIQQSFDLQDIDSQSQQLVYDGLEICIVTCLNISGVLLAISCTLMIAQMIKQFFNRKNKNQNNVISQINKKSMKHISKNRRKIKVISDDMLIQFDPGYKRPRLGKQNFKLPNFNKICRFNGKKQIIKLKKQKKDCFNENVLHLYIYVQLIFHLIECKVSSYHWITILIPIHYSCSALADPTRCLCCHIIPIHHSDFSSFLNFDLNHDWSYP